MIGDIFQNPIVLALILLAAIIVIVLVINLIKKKKKKKKQEQEIMPKLNEWVKQAKEAGMNYTQIRTKLEITGWDSKYVQKALKNNGMKKPEGYK
jgi:predicted peroxiredoxin